jgi:hypothetical protein
MPHKLTYLNRDRIWLESLAAADVEELRASWARVTPKWPGWKLVALARRLRVLGVTVSVPARIVRVLTARCVHRESPRTWAALPVLLRMTGQVVDKKLFDVRYDV